ncbi:tetratricopeptide repeat protein [Roseomonas stagni]|uniref:Tetratricopeptide repeat protein 38 n=1 Tax=Falsiroseomonas algicola TaxID=2716930 RepID=A0A6M1LRD6_9PROT|nr:tetratricopeptide repeat protein [Falsiroseomonas algicola]NGM23001.1 tetratricopeptide repeat protein [Falsiroseomonas algicola]
MQDAQGNALTVESEEAARAFDHVIAGFLNYRFDTGLRLKAFRTLDPTAPLGQLLSGYFALMAYDRGMAPRALAAVAAAEAMPANPRERAHMAALREWAEGRPEGALSAWERIIADHPHDLLAFRLHHFSAFWMGEPGRMRAAVERVMHRWSEAIPGYGSVLACRCFAHEECGDYLIAEQAGRQAVAMDRGDLWAAHGVAHVLEMQGRRTEGLDWIRALEPNWDGGNNLMHHLWWHQAMFHMERREYGAVLDLYDTRFRNLSSPVTQAQPDLYIDMQNAASMLFRLQLRGLDPGDRWTELAEKAEARIGDTLSAFTQPHWMMALVATGRRAAATRLLEALGEAGRANTHHAAILREAALPACQAVMLHGEGRFAEAVAVLRPALGALHRLGGSHAQQDVLEQLFLDAAMKAGSAEDTRLALERAAGRYALSPARRIGYAEAALAVPF